uniref:Uncharacterized protein n=1 Tax=Bionectria ochroleuca TaxID=29856 RepID=A0A8H7TS49_BIOOC
MVAERDGDGGPGEQTRAESSRVEPGGAVGAGLASCSGYVPKRGGRKACWETASLIRPNRPPTKYQSSVSVVSVDTYSTARPVPSRPSPFILSPSIAASICPHTYHVASAPIRQAHHHHLLQNSLPSIPTPSCDGVFTLHAISPPPKETWIIPSPFLASSWDSDWCLIPSHHQTSPSSF